MANEDAAPDPPVDMETSTATTSASEPAVTDAALQENPAAGSGDAAVDGENEEPPSSPSKAPVEMSERARKIQALVALEPPSRKRPN